MAALGRPRPPWPPFPEFAGPILFHESFDWAYSYGLTNAELVIANYGTLRESWTGMALQRSGTVTPFVVPALDATGCTNVASHTESAARFWLTPYWSSLSLAGTGPGASATLAEMVASDGKDAVVVWSLQATPDGSALVLLAHGDAGAVELLRADIAWAQTAHCIALNFGPDGSALFVDGALVAKGGATLAVPSKVAGLVFGSAWTGNASAEGDLEEICVFGRPLSEAAVALYYTSYAKQAALGPLSDAEWQAQRDAAAKRKAEREAALALGQNGGGGMMSLDSGGCSGLTLTTTLLTNSNLQIGICSKEPGAVYDLIFATNLNPTITWHWAQEIATNVSTVEIVTTNYPYLFFRLKQIPDLDGDGLRDYWEWGGSVPGSVVIDDDRDHDGIPDSIEAASGSATNDPSSLPPPSWYVNNNAAAGGDGSLDLPFRDIQTALNAATNFSVILVKAGTYNGTSNRNLSFGGKKLVLLAEKGWEETRIDCGDAANRAFAFTSTNEDYHAQILGFTITNAGASAVSASGGSAPTFVNCQFIGNNAGAVAVTNASPVFVNCRFLTNSTSDGGAAIYATGSGSLVRLSHCTLNDNVRANNGGQVFATGGATITLNNSIVWGVRTDLGAEIAASGGSAGATYCDVRGGYTGDGNISSDPLFESNGSARLTINSPCLDRGVTNSVPGFALFTRYDMDGEARLDYDGTGGQPTTTDIGADEYVYRLQFPLDANNYSVVDEASGVSYLGTNATGPLIAVVDDESRTDFRVFQLNSNASQVALTITNDIRNLSYTNAGDREIHDLEGLTFDPATRQLYPITSQTKRNRYRDVDNIDTDPVNDPPSNDYDRRRSLLARLTLDATLTNVTARTFFESESNGVPASVGYDAYNGLAALVRQRLTNNAALGDKTVTNKVLIARNTVNKFGTPVNGVTYANGALLPYSNGGPSATAGTSLGEFTSTSGLLTNSVVSNTWYYYKIWAIDANTNYTAGLVSSNRTDGLPKLFINEFMASGTGDDWIEIYNPAHVPVNMAGLQITDDPAHQSYTIPSNSVAGRGYLRFYANNTSNGVNLPFALGAGGEHIRVQAVVGGVTNIIDDYGFGNQSSDVTEGRVWDAGPRGFVSITNNCDGAKFRTNSSFQPTSLAVGGFAGPATNNHSQPLKQFLATADVRGTNMYLEWRNVGMLPATWRYSPKQHDFHAINIEDVAFRSTNEMVFGLRAPLSNRTNGNAYYFVATNLATFLPAGGWTNGPCQGVGGPYEMNLGGLGIRSIKWCPHGLTNASGQGVQRYLVLAGNANGGPLVREKLRQKFSLLSWDGNTAHQPTLLLDDLIGYAIRPEGVEIINVNGEWRLFFVEDRFQARGYATRNALHWPVSILGAVN